LLKPVTKPQARSRKTEAGVQPAYVAGLRLLARRELTEAQVRERLSRRGHQDADIDAAVNRLKEERALDDARVAAAMARTGVTVKRRGRLRLKRELDAAGIAAPVAREALDAVFGSLDPDDLLEAALRRRLRDGRLIADDREFQRLYRYLAGQGFESDRILAALGARRAGRRETGSDTD
jgi:regulatory protein